MLNYNFCSMRFLRRWFSEWLTHSRPEGKIALGRILHTKGFPARIQFPTDSCMSAGLRDHRGVAARQRPPRLRLRRRPHLRLLRLQHHQQDRAGIQVCLEICMHAGVMYAYVLRRRFFRPYERFGEWRAVEINILYLHHLYINLAFFTFQNSYKTYKYNNFDKLISIQDPIC